MKLEKGMYVRNKYGIAKIIDIKNTGFCDVITFDKNICFAYDHKTKEEIVGRPLVNKLPITKDIDIDKINASHNIIDLIEVGDYVNGCQVIGFDKQDKIANRKCLYLDSYCKYDTDIHIYNENVESIVTKEKFENMEYRIGE